MPIAAGTVSTKAWEEAVEAAPPGWLVLFASWARTEPERGRYDEDEIVRGRKALSAARRRGLEPVVVLHAGALPDWQIAREGWLDPDGLAAWGCYADRAAHGYGDHVRYWFSLWDPLGEAAWYDGDTRRVSRLMLDAQASAYLHLKRAPGYGGRPGIVGVMQRVDVSRVGRPDPGESLFHVLATGKLVLPFGPVGELPNGTPAVDLLGIDGGTLETVDRLWRHGRGVVLRQPGLGEAAWARGVRILAELQSE